MPIVGPTPPVRPTPPGKSQCFLRGSVPPNVQRSSQIAYSSGWGSTFTDFALSIGRKFTEPLATYKKSKSQNDLARLLDNPSSNEFEILNLINSMTQDQLNHVAENGDSALLLALAKDADPEIITALAKKCDVNLSLDDNNDTALLIAVFYKYPIDGILALIEAMTKEQLNHVTKNGDSALRLALLKDADPKIIQALAKKCDVNVSLNDNYTALELAIWNKYPIDGILALIEAMTPDQLNHVTKGSRSALELALSKNADPKIIKALAKKCDVNQSLNKNNDTALTIAILKKFPIDGILTLIEAMTPKQLNHVTKKGHSALGLALRRLPVYQGVRFLLAYAKKHEDKLKTACLSIFTAVAIPMIIYGLKTVKKTVMERLDIQRIEALYNQYLQIDDVEQKKDKLTQLLKTITDKKMEPLGELARLITLQLALLKHEDLSGQDIQEYFENTHFLDVFNELMDDDPDPNDVLWRDIVSQDRILARDVEFFINPDKERPFDGVVSVDSVEQFRQTHPTSFSTTERAAAYMTN
jgi:hypothetical protein